MYFPDSLKHIIWCVVAALPLLTFSSATAQEGEPEFGPGERPVVYEYAEVYPGPSKKEKTKKYPSIRDLRPYVKGMCLGLARDGRAEWLFEQLAHISKEEYRSCPGCKQIFKEFIKYCRPGTLEKSRKKKKIRGKRKDSLEEKQSEEPTPTPTPVPGPPKAQREPRLEVLDYASRLFHELSNDEKNFDETVRAVKRFNSILRMTEGTSSGQQSYYGILATFAYAPFEGYDREMLLKNRAEERLRQEAARELGLDDSFYYYDEVKEERERQKLRSQP